MTQDTQQNIQLFNYFTGEMFARLYAALPNPINIDCYEIAKEEKFVAADWWTEQENGAHVELAKSRASQDPRVRTCLNTGRWLRQEGFINFAVPSAVLTIDLSLRQATLGHKGLIAVRRFPPELDSECEPEETFGDTLLRLAQGSVLPGRQAAMAEVASLLLINTG